MIEFSGVKLDEKVSNDNDEFALTEREGGLPGWILQREQVQWVSTGRVAMLSYAVIFLIVAIIAGVLGFGGIAGAAATIAKVLFVIFLILFVVSLIRGRGR